MESLETSGFNFRRSILQLRESANSYASPLDLPEKHVMKTWVPYSLPYTFMSSYACYFFTPNVIGHASTSEQQHRNNLYSWKGLVSPFKDVVISQVSAAELEITSPNSIPRGLISYMRSILGLDSRPSEELPEQFGKLPEAYPGVRIPCLNQNLLDVLIAVLCSTHALITNARRWFIFLKDHFGQTGFLLEENPLELMRLVKKEIGSSMGYRARVVIEALTDLSENGEWPEHHLRTLILRSPIERARRNLLGVKYIGPKVADCFLLNALGVGEVPPVDVNVKRVCDRLGFLGEGLSLPIPGYCQNYLCEGNCEETCPRYNSTSFILEQKNQIAREGCLRAALKLRFQCPGWAQALLFLLGIEYCQSRTPRCDVCPMSQSCHGPKVVGLSSALPKREHIRRSSSNISYVEVLKKPLILPNVMTLYPEKASELQNQIDKLTKELSPLKSNRRLLLACATFVSARLLGVPVIMQDISEFYSVDCSILFKLVQQASIRLKIRILPPKPEEYADLLLRKLDLSLNNPASLSDLLRTRYRPGLSPLPLAAATLHFTLQSEGRTISLKRIAQVSSISEMTLRKYRAMLEVYEK